MEAILGIRCWAEWLLANLWAVLGLDEEYQLEKSGLYSGSGLYSSLIGGLYSGNWGLYSGS